MQPEEPIPFGNPLDPSSGQHVDAPQHAAEPQPEQQQQQRSGDAGAPAPTGLQAAPREHTRAPCPESLAGQLQKLEDVRLNFMAEYHQRNRRLVAQLVGLCQDSRQREQQKTEDLEDLKSESLVSLSRKDQTIGQLQARLDELSQENDLLHRELEQLREELTELRSHDRQTTLLLDAKNQSEQRARSELHAAQQSLQAVLESLQSDTTEPTPKADDPNEPTAGLYCSKFLEESNGQCSPVESIPLTRSETAEGAQVDGFCRSTA